MQVVALTAGPRGGHPRSVPPKPLWSELAVLERRLARASHLRLASDFDGTLAHIVRLPGLAVVRPRARRALGRLARLPRARVALVSGRRLTDLSRRAHVPGVFLAGLLGIETRAPGVRKKRVNLRRGQRVPPALHRQLEELCEAFPGAWLEPKGWSAALHYRALPAGRVASFRAAARALVRRHRDSTELAEAKMAFEIRPRGAPGKAETLDKWLGPTGDGRLDLFIGDDALDEEAHALVRRRGGIGILVGDRASRARYRLGDPDQVARFLEWLEKRWRDRVR
jgi:trehalose 6-phosphate phosphatase